MVPPQKWRCQAAIQGLETFCCGRGKVIRVLSSLAAFLICSLSAYRNGFGPYLLLSTPRGMGLFSGAAGVLVLV